MATYYPAADEMAAYCPDLDETLTTVMIKNIPSRASPQEVMQTVDALGFQGAYDFFYLPCRNMNAKSETMSVNHGYAFINFRTAWWGRLFMDAVTASVVMLRSSPKMLSTSYGYVQGVDALVRRIMRTKPPVMPFVASATGELIQLQKLTKTTSKRSCSKETEEDAETCEGSDVSSTASELSEPPTRVMTVEVDGLPARSRTPSAEDLPEYIFVDSKYYEDVAVPPGLAQAAGA
eukprot:TRINITY_DN2313_c0_g1_i1.p1 TRINITY_DN2313_c0_g1~~TRINITY_DN2313_c0_g1_i1.p1  ORF type:complete len:234 (-),score=26.91 TRINITY_DN2313_c0_g1_i1:428-1129(-)